MTIIQFYHLTTTPLERVLPKLMEKAYGGGFKTLLIAGSDERVDQLNQLLWTYDPNSFLPHGGVKEGNSEQQPILLSTRIEIANQANLLAITDGTLPENAKNFDRILDIFDGNDTQAVEKARSRWTSYKNSGCPVTYFRQTENGGWEQKVA